LYHALSAGLPVLPIFIFDTTILDKLPNKDDKRVGLIYNRLLQLNKTVNKNNSNILTFIGTPLQIFKQLKETYTINAVYTNNDYEPQAILRDTAIAAYLQQNEIAFHSFKDQVIFEKNELLKLDNTPYTIFTPYANVWKKKLINEPINLFPSQNNLDHLLKQEAVPMPTLAQIGFTITTPTTVPTALNLKILPSYHLNRNMPWQNATSQLSVALRFGFVSVRQLVLERGPVNEQWLNELIWREFFMMILFHYPEVVNQSFKKKYDNIKWRNNEEEFLKWCNGTTGYPIVDAGMRQLNETGLMHNRVRMIVASFLTKHLLIDWRWGEAYFAEKLLDYELSANNGNWQWAAGCGCDAAPYFRIFNPYEQVKKFDAQLLYINTWVKNINQLDYPKPIVDHKMARERVLKAYKTALNPIL
jgi:deoxyribodipyrimidine photo-lyase